MVDHLVTLGLDVQSFGTPGKAAASYFLQVRDIGAAPPSGFVHCCMRGDGNAGIGTSQPDANRAIAQQAGDGAIPSETGGCTAPLQGSGAVREWADAGKAWCHPSMKHPIAVTLSENERASRNC